MNVRLATGRRVVTKGMLLVAPVDIVRAGAPISRSVVDAVPRPQLFAVLDQQASLTVIQAPPGFGKRTLVGSWLHRGGAGDRDVLWVDVADEHADPSNSGNPGTSSGMTAVSGVDADNDAVYGAAEAADPGARWNDEVEALAAGSTRCVVVVTVGSTRAAAVLETVAELLGRCPSAVAVVAVHGTIAPPAVTPVRGIDCRWIRAAQLCFTAAETAELGRSRGLSLGDERYADLQDMLGGVPPLVTSAVAMLQVAPVVPVDDDGRLVPAVDRVVDDYVQERMRRLDDRARRFAVLVVVLRSATIAEAAEVTRVSLCEELLEQLDAAGLMVESYDGVQRTWTWPTVVRENVLDTARRERPGNVERILARLADERLSAGRYAEAAEYAVDARDWDVAERIVDEHWSEMVADHFATLVRLLRAVPESVVDRYPGVAAGKALFVQSLTGHPMLNVAVPTDPADVAVVGAGPEAGRALHVGSVQAIALRMAGSLIEAGERAGSLGSLVQAMLEHQPHNVTAQLPTIRLQWAICMQLAGDLPAATAEFERAYRDALAAGFDFVVLNAAGSIAANWALSGDLARVDEWLDAEARVDTKVGYWDEMVRVGGRVATVLARLDRLDFEGAKSVLDLLGIPPTGEELWGLVAYAHAQYALISGDAYTGLTLLHRVSDGHRNLHQPGALSHVLLTAAEIDLLLALGKGNVARAVAASDNSGHPLVVVAAARVEMLTGHPEAARAMLTRISWPDCGWPRAHLEALLIEAATDLHTDREGAARAWARATTLADALGNRRAWSTVQEPVRRELAELTGTAEPEDLPVGVFPESVSEVVLTAREREVLVHLDRGVARKDLAQILFVSNNTIKTQLRSIYSKLEVHTLTGALTRARELRLIP